MLIHELATARFVGQREDALFLGPLAPARARSHPAGLPRRLSREAHTLIEEIADDTRATPVVAGFEVSINGRF